MGAVEAHKQRRKQQELLMKKQEEEMKKEENTEKMLRAQERKQLENELLRKEHFQKKERDKEAKAKEAEEATEAKAKEAEAKKEFYVPTMIRGIKVIEEEGNGVFLVDNTELHSTAPGLGVREEEEFGDFQKEYKYIPWGTKVRGKLDGKEEDEWLQLESGQQALLDKPS